jgi:predicted nucleic acid-binding protein
MTFSSCLTNQDSILVLDASVIINLLATDHASAILQALPTPIVVTDNVIREIELGAVNGRPESKQLLELIHNQILKSEVLSGIALEHFFDLVSGSTAASLGDGEAATLALAHSNGFTAVIDEKKATTISSERFETLHLITTVDILAYEPVRISLGDEALSVATLQALKNARMQVRENQFDWIQGVIGCENVGLCPSLRRLVKLKAARSCCIGQ